MTPKFVSPAQTILLRSRPHISTSLKRNHQLSFLSHLPSDLLFLLQVLSCHLNCVNIFLRPEKHSTPNCLHVIILMVLLSTATY